MRNAISLSKYFCLNHPSLSHLKACFECEKTHEFFEIVSGLNLFFKHSKQAKTK